MSQDELRIEPQLRKLSVLIVHYLSLGEPRGKTGGIGIGIADVCPSVCLPNSMSQEKTKTW